MIRIIDTCEDLPMYNYIRCLVHKDLSHLLTERDKGFAAENRDKLLAAWEKIQGEYMELTQGSMDMYVLTTYFELEALRVKKMVVMSAVELANDYMMPGFFSLLQEYGYDFPFDLKDPESCIKELKRVLKRSKKIDFDIEEAEGKLKSAKKDEVKIDVQFFDKILNALSKFMGSHIDEKVMTVSRYAACLNAYNQYVEQLKTTQHGGTGEA